jgi:hypothetical protein
VAPAVAVTGLCLPTARRIFVLIEVSHEIGAINPFRNIVLTLLGIEPEVERRRVGLRLISVTDRRLMEHPDA